MTLPVTRPASGFTLVEMLVVLMIAGMALALGYQSLSQWRLASTRLTATSETLREARLGRAWFEGSVRALTPIADSPFSGDARTFTGVTLEPVLTHAGAPTLSEWSIEWRDGRALLALTEGDERLELPLESDDTARFEYVDTTGRAHSQWPPPLGMADHLPASVVLLRTDQTGVSRPWAVSVSGIRNPPALAPMYEPDQD